MDVLIPRRKHQLGQEYEIIDCWSALSYHIRNFLSTFSNAGLLLKSLECKWCHFISTAHVATMSIPRCGLMPDNGTSEVKVVWTAILGINWCRKECWHNTLMMDTVWASGISLDQSQISKDMCPSVCDWYSIMERQLFPNAGNWLLTRWF